MLLFLYHIVIACCVTISMTTSISADVLMRYECARLFFSLSSQLETPHPWLQDTFTFCWNFTICVLAKSPWDEQHQIQDQLSSPYFHLPLQSHPDPPTNSGILILKWLKAVFGFHLSSGCVWNCVVCHHYRPQATDRQNMEFQLQHKHVTTLWLIQEQYGGGSSRALIVSLHATKTLYVQLR